MFTGDLGLVYAMLQIRRAVDNSGDGLASSH